MRRTLSQRVAARRLANRPGTTVKKASVVSTLHYTLETVVKETHLRNLESQLEPVISALAAGPPLRWPRGLAALHR